MENNQSGSMNILENEYKAVVPEVQIAFYLRLKEIKEKYLERALATTIGKIDIEILDKELVRFAGKDKITFLAKQGLRGEIFFPVPYLLESNPFLLGYYRLLFGFSNKEFYDQGMFGLFKSMEEKGKITSRQKDNLSKFCESLIETSWMLINHLDHDGITPDVIKELQILTVGPQLRGSRNTVLGQVATKVVFEHIKTLLSGYIINESERKLVIKNDSNRNVTIAFSSDPDIKIIESLPSGDRNLVAIEIKGGTDISNIHNRLGEAEKSHQKARNRGFNEFWTIIAVDIAEDKIKKESPTTTRFFNLDQIINPTHPKHHEFIEHLSSLLSIQIKAIESKTKGKEIKRDGKHKYKD